MQKLQACLSLLLRKSTTVSQIKLEGILKPGSECIPNEAVYFMVYVGIMAAMTSRSRNETAKLVLSRLHRCSARCFHGLTSFT
jgi:hypothetical protein